MPAYRKLPDAEVLRKLAEEERMTNAQIAKLYGVTSEGVRQGLLAAGIKPVGIGQRVDHSKYLPWPNIRSNHMSHVLARRLRAYSKRAQGKKLSTTEGRLLDEWIEYMDGENPQGVPLAVHYSRADKDGFWLEPRQDGDEHLISPPSKRRR